MFYSPGLLYIHGLPRSGGTFIGNILEREGLGSQTLTDEIGGHDGVRQIPEQILSRALVFGTIRDPWSWYCSIDAHYRHKAALDGFLLEYFGRKITFKEALLGMTVPSRLTFLRRDRSARYPGARHPVVGLPGLLEDSKIGLWTFMILRQYCLAEAETIPGVGVALSEGLLDLPWGVQALVDTAQLREGLSQVITAWRPDIGQRLSSVIQSAAAVNSKSNHRGVLPNGRPDPAVFDQEMQEAVWERDGALMQLFNLHLPVGNEGRAPVLLT